MHREPSVEPLENRRLLSGGTPQLSGANTLLTAGTIDGNGAVNFQYDSGTLVLAGADVVHLTSRGTLVVHGTDTADVIGVELGRGKVLVTRKPGPGGLGAGFILNFDSDKVKRVLVEAGGGDDRVGVARDIGRRCTLAGGTGNDSLGGSAGDTLIGGSGNDKLSIIRVQPRTDGQTITYPDASQGNALLSGGDGDDRLFAIGTDTVVGGRGDDTAVVDFYFISNGTVLPAIDAKSIFADRAIGIEHFDAVITTLSTGTVAPVIDLQLRRGI